MANQNEKILMSLLSIEENEKCCDCGSRGAYQMNFYVAMLIATYEK